MVSIGRDILAGLAAAHGAGIVHRDMKPDNIFLLDDPSVGTSVKILDLGIAKNLQSTGASAVLTKPGDWPTVAAWANGSAPLDPPTPPPIVSSDPALLRQSTAPAPRTRPSCTRSTSRT